MSTIVLRSVKGSPLTNAEVDANFTNLNNDKIELGGTYSSGTTSGVLFLNGSKVLATSANMTFNGTRLTVADLTDSSLSESRVTYAGAGGNLVDSANLTFNSQNLVLNNTAAATPVDGTWALNVDGNANAAADFSANAEAYVINTQSAKNQFFQAGTLVTLTASTAPTSVNSAALIDFNAYNSSNGASNIFLGAIAGNTNAAANFVLGRRIGTNSWAESLRVDTNGGLITTPAAGGHTVFNENGVDADFRVETDGDANALFVDGGSNNVAIGTSTNFGNSTKFGVQADGTNGAVAFARNTDNAFAVATDYYKSRGSPSSPAAVQNNDGIYQLRSVPFQGSGYTYLNSMVIEVDGTYTSGQNPPTRIIFSTNTANGSPTERLAIKSNELVVNDASADFDFRVESDTNTHAFFVDAGQNKVGFGCSDVADARVNIQSPGVDGTFDPVLAFQYATNSNEVNTIGTSVSGSPGGSGINFRVSEGSGSTTTRETLRLTRAAAVFNEDGEDRDFRIESVNNTNMLFVDAGNNFVNVALTTGVANAGALQIGAGGGTSSSIGINNSDNATISARYGLVFQADNQDNIGSRFHEFRIGGKGYSDGRSLASFKEDECVFNDTSRDQDFRVESDANTHMLFVDAGNNGVNIGNNGATPPLSGLRVAGGFNPRAGIISEFQIQGFVAVNYSGTRYWLLQNMDIPAQAFNCQGDLVAASYSVWNNSRIFIRRSYDSFTVTASITGIAKSGVTVSVVDITYSSVRYLAIKFDGGDPAINANLIGYLMNQMYLNGTDASFINGTAGVTENAVIASY
jgi:hypothetical protein